MRDGERKKERVIDIIFSIFTLQVTDNLTCAWPENSRLVKIIFLGNVETVIRSGVKFRFDMLGSSTSDIISGLWFSL